MTKIKQLQNLKDNKTLIFKVQNLISEIIKEKFNISIESDSVEINYTQDEKFGDLACNIALKVSKELSKNPRELAEEIIQSNLLQNELVSKCEVAGPGFINIFINQDFFVQNLTEVIYKKEEYGKWNVAEGKVMCEYGSPNAFKSLHVGHLRNTITGFSCQRILENLGYSVISANFPSDIGMHVARSIWAYLERGGKPDGFDNLSPNQKLDYIVDCYVFGNTKFKEDEEIKLVIQDINKKVFFKTDEKLVEVYQQLLGWSFDYLNEFFALLNIKHDKEYPESSLVDEAKRLVEENTGKVFTKNEGAIIFDGKEYKIPTSVFLTSNEIPTYAAKDLALAYTKFRDFPDLEFSLVFTAVEQIDHFKAVIKALELIDSKFIDKYYHFAYGWVLSNGKKASTKLGNTVNAFDFINESTEYSLTKISENKEYDQETALNIAKKIGLAGLKFLFLSHEFHKDINYNPEQFLNPEGFSGPYLMYGYVRTQSILRNANLENNKLEVEISKTEMNDIEIKLLKLLAKYPNITLETGKTLSPHITCSYLFELTQLFNQFYRENKVLVDDENIRNFRLTITEAVGIVLKNGLDLLGIETVVNM